MVLTHERVKRNKGHFVHTFAIAVHSWASQQESLRRCTFPAGNVRVGSEEAHVNSTQEVGRDVND